MRPAVFRVPLERDVAVPPSDMRVLRVSLTECSQRRHDVPLHHLSSPRSTACTVYTYLSTTPRLLRLTNFGRQVDDTLCQLVHGRQ